MADTLDDDFVLDVPSNPGTKRARFEDEDDFEIVEDIAAEALEADQEAGEDGTDAEPAVKPSSAKKQKKDKKPPKKQKKEIDWNAKSLILRTEIFGLARSQETLPEDLPADRSIESLLKYLASANKADGKILIVTPSAERAIAVIPVLKPLGKVAKLFARHMKVEEQIKALKSSAFPVCVGTPNRVLKLFEAGALESGKLGLVILDGTSRDKKERSLFDIPELKADLVAFLKETSANKVVVF